MSVAVTPIYAADRAVWTWELDSYTLLESHTAATDALDFLQAQGINTVYLYADAYRGKNLLVERPKLYREFITMAHDRQFKVFALLGSYHLKTERYVLPEYRKPAEAMVQRVLDYNVAAPVAARFDGINLDIEPHLMDRWNDDTRQALVLQFIEISARWMEMKAASGATLAIGPAMPFWFDNIPIQFRGVTKPASEHMQDVYDYVALMDYRNKAEGRDSITSHAQDEMDYAARIGKPVVIGLEITSNDLKKVTFHHLKKDDLTHAMDVTERHFAGSKAFGGFVLHHYSGYRNWLARQADPNH